MTPHAEDVERKTQVHIFGNPDSTTDPDLEVVDCGNSKAAYKVEQKKDDNSGCDRTKYAEYTETGGSSDFTLCLSEYSTK